MTRRWAREALCVAVFGLILWMANSFSTHSAHSLAYVGPGAGFAFLGSFLTLVFSVVASLASFLIWPFRWAWVTVRRRGTTGKAQVERAIFLGLDGLDPGLTERWMAEGKLPNLVRLREQGCYSRLRTTTPPLSPVAWSTFATGVNPAKHNIFDFLNRDLRTYAPALSSAKVHRASGSAKASVELRQKSEPFWKILGRNFIGSTILRVPITFPPEPFPGRLLSAMATPDLLGTQGSFSFFTTEPRPPVSEGGTRLPFTVHGEELRAQLPGPEGTFIPFCLKPASVSDERKLEIQGQSFLLRTGEYTPWVRLRFPGGRFRKIWGVARFLLTGTHPNAQLYVTPIEIDPANPALPISHPRYYSAYLAKLFGTFATLGMAEDTWALNEGAIDRQAFLQQAKLIQAERELMFFNALKTTRRGVVACVFDTTDRVQHMFYSCMDSDSPHAMVIEDLYRDMDRLVGQTMEQMDDSTALFVLSDHGFSSFRRGVNLNSWLERNGYLVRKPDANRESAYLDGIDWSQTRAYTFGLSGLYLNRQGREAKGIVAAAQVAGLKAELIAKLTNLMDEELQQVAIQTVYDSEVVYKGPYLDAGPDLIPGYAAGYRASWSAAVGAVTSHVFEENTKCWSGDHCVDPILVPGVLFANRPFHADDPGIEDLAPTVLQLFGIAPPAWMEGKPLIPAV